MKETVLAPSCLSLLEKEVVSALCYFDVFRHPLTAEEISRLIVLKTDTSELLVALLKLCDQKVIKEKSGFYLLFDSDDGNVQRRLNGELAASKALIIAKKKSAFISRFPFVEGVCISGSLSKNYFDSDADVDFFIITKPGRLWVCRTLLVAWKKIFMLNSRKYFCVNYFIDTENLSIPDRNLFTAVEISFLKPVYNFESYSAFIQCNSWISEFLPNVALNDGKACLPVKKYRFKSFAERLMSGSFGEWLDNYFFKITLRRWKKKFAHFNVSDFDLNMRSRKTVSKHHPQGFQAKVMAAYNERLQRTANCFEN